MLVSPDSATTLRVGRGHRVSDAFAYRTRFSLLEEEISSSRPFNPRCLPSAFLSPANSPPNPSPASSGHIPPSCLPSSMQSSSPIRVRCSVPATGNALVLINCPARDPSLPPRAMAR